LARRSQAGITPAVSSLLVAAAAAEAVFDLPAGRQVSWFKPVLSADEGMKSNSSAVNP